MKHSKVLTTTVCCILVVSIAAKAQTQTLTKAQYRDKTLAMILGSIGGALTGYEYLNVYDTPTGFYQSGASMKIPKEPLLCLPEEWFILMNGTLGGTTKDEYNYAPWIMGKGRINSDDDQHIDFFNQWLLNQYGLSISYEDMKREWMAKQVSDFGGGQGAVEVMRDKDLMAPQCGHRDHGNSGHWLPECYIEHEMMGAAFPGMPNKAANFAQKFSEMTGEGEVVTWGYYWATAHSLAFFESDVRTVVQKALGMLPANCRPRQMYDICVMLKNKYPNDWRAAVRELWKDHWSAPFAVGYDKVMMLGDVNNGTAFLSILYGNNDYLQTLKISCLAGGDGDCTASAVGGLLGIVKGMAGTPQKFKDDIYNNGNGFWINDVVHAFSIKKDFKIEWKYDQLVDMYQQNAEMAIRAFGGIVTTNGYTIQTQDGAITPVATNNWDFEKGTLEGWKTWTSGGSSSIWAERQCDNNTLACFAGSGKYKGTILTNSVTSEAKLYQTVTGLKPGTTYKLEGRTHTAAGHEARFYAENYGGHYLFASTTGQGSPFLYQFLYVTLGPTNTSLDVGLHVPAANGGWSNIDDLILYEMPNVGKSVRYEAETAVLNDAKVTTSPTASGGSYVGWINMPNVSYVEFQNVMADYTGEYIVRINFANGGAYSTQKVMVNGNVIGLIEHGNTGPWGQFSANNTDAYVKLTKGKNTIRLVANSNFAEIDCIDLVSPYGSEGKPADGAELVDGGIYKIVAKHSQKVLDVNGAITNGSFIIQNSFTGSKSQFFKIHKVNGRYFITPLDASQSVEMLGNGMNNTDQVGLWDYWQGEGQQWAILDAYDNGYYKIINHRSGKAMDVAGGSMADGATVFQYDYLKGNNQKWRFDFVGMSESQLPSVIPGLIQAEQFSHSSGIQIENTTDIGAGKNVGFIENGDWLEFNVEVLKTGSFTFGFRVASATTGGSITIKSDNAILGTISISGTNGWQSWKTVEKPVFMAQGTHTLRLEFTGGAGSLFNLNWVDANLDSVVTALEDDSKTGHGVNVYPNPVRNILYIKSSDLTQGHLVIYDSKGEEVAKQEGCIGSVNVEHLTKGLYLIILNGSHKARFIKN